MCKRHRIRHKPKEFFFFFFFFVVVVVFVVVKLMSDSPDRKSFLIQLGCVYAEIVTLPILF